MSADAKFLQAVIDEVAGRRRLSREEAERLLIDDKDLEARTVSLVAVDHGYSDDEGRLMYNRGSVERMNAWLDEWRADRLERERQATSAPPEREDPRFLALLEDHDRLDGVIRALNAELGEPGYTEALMWVQDQYDRWCDHRDREACEEVTLGTVLAGSAVTLDQLTTQVRTLDKRRENELVTLAEDVDTPAPDGDVVQFGGESRVKFAAGIDPDEVLADPVAPRRAWREVKNLKDQRAIGDNYWTTYEEFAEHWRTYGEEGYDLAKTVQLWAHEKEVRLAKEAAEAAALQQEKAAKANKARESEEAARKLSEEAQNRHRESLAGQHGVGELMTLDAFTRGRLTGGL